MAPTAVSRRVPALSAAPIAILVLVAAACGAPASDAARSPVGSVPPSAAPVRSASPSPAPTASFGTTANPDGSVRIRPPTLFDFAQPGDGAVWGILQHAGVGRDIVRIDPETYELRTVVSGLPILPSPVAPLVAHGSIWLVSWDKSSVTQFDAETGELIREVQVGEHPIEPVLAYGDVWTINHDGDSVTRINAQSGEAHPSIDLPGSHPLSITVVAPDLMIVSGPSPVMFLVDPQRMELIGTYEPSECYEGAAAMDGLLWLKRCNEGEIAVVEPRTGEVLDTFETIALPSTPLIVDDIVWLPFAADDGPGTFGLVGLDPDTHAVIGRYEQPVEIREGSAFAAFDSWWRWGWEGLLRVPADTLRAAVP